MDGPLVPLAAQYGHVARRRRPNKAAVAGAPSMVVAAWHILTTATISTTSAPTTSTPTTQGLAQRKLADLEALGWQATVDPGGSVTLSPPALVA